MKKIYILLFVIILLLVPTMVYADSDIPLPNDGYNYYFVTKASSGKIFYITTAQPSVVIFYYQSSNIDRYAVKSGVGYKYYYFDGKKFHLQHQGKSPGLGSGYNLDEVLASNYNIYYDDSHPLKAGQVFFSPPKVNPLVNGMKKADSGMILRTISHGLILVSGCLILAICFRKAWAFLHNQLQH